MIAPHFDPEIHGIYRVGLATILLLFYLQTLPLVRRFFVSERWGGYVEASPFPDRLHHPVVMRGIYALWGLSLLGLFFQATALFAALINFCFTRNFFIAQRWKGLARGLGAPGFIANWSSMALLLLETFECFWPASTPLALLTLQVDFALIILAAGIYKFTAGYPKNEGMELGCVNQQWAYWKGLYEKLGPRHPIVHFLNQTAWFTEILAAVLMLVPQTRAIGGALLMMIFLFIATQLRLGFLCINVVCIGGLYLHGWDTGPNTLSLGAHPMAELGLLLYLALLPFAYGGMYLNFYGQRRLPDLLQVLLDRYTNLFGMILWRVFTQDVINFTINIHAVGKDGSRRSISDFRPFKSWRFGHVAECITVTTLFSALKYFPSQPHIFEQRLKRYGNTLDLHPGETLVFEYISIQKDENAYRYPKVSEFHLDPVSGTIEEKTLDPNFCVRSKAKASPVMEAAKAGSYAPKA